MDIGRLDWTLEDNMVNDFFFATLTSRRSGHTTFVLRTAETCYTDAEAVELDPTLSVAGLFQGGG